MGVRSLLVVILISGSLMFLLSLTRLDVVSCLLMTLTSKEVRGKKLGHV